MSDSVPFFSVVIPTYNRAALLRRALDSVFAQHCGDLEVVVVDNSSSDGTGPMLAAIGDARLRVATVQNHGVIAYSRNVGMRLARGCWVAFLDSDDTWLPDKLAQVRRQIARWPDGVLVAHDVWIVDGQQRRYLRYGPRRSDLRESLMLYGNCFSPSAVTVRRDAALSAGGFSEDPAFATAEDYEFWLRLGAAGPHRFIGRALGEWHVHGDNASHRALVHSAALARVFEHHLVRWRREAPHLGLKPRIAAGRLYGEIGRFLLRAGHFEQARHHACRALGRMPVQWRAWVVLVLAAARVAL